MEMIAITRLLRFEYLCFCITSLTHDLSKITCEFSEKSKVILCASDSSRLHERRISEKIAFFKWSFRPDTIRRPLRFILIFDIIKAHYTRTVWQIKLRLLHCLPVRERREQAIGRRLVNQATTIMGGKEVDTDQLSFIKQMFIEKVETERILDGEMADIVPDDELEAEIQGANEYKERLYSVLALAKVKKALEAPSSAATVSPAPLPSVRHPAPADRRERSDPSTIEPASPYGTRYVYGCFYTRH